MILRRFSRSLTLFLAITVIFLCGCLSRSQTPRFYTLSSMQEGQGSFPSKTSAANAEIGIGPVKLADYLDDPKIVTRTRDHQLVKAEYDRWVGSFKDDFINALSDNIGFLLSTDRIHRYPWRQSVPIDYQITVDVLRCDGRLGEAAWLVARWSVLQGPERKVLKMERSSISEPVTGADYAALVAAQSRAVAALSQEIARAIQGASGAAGRARPASPGASSGGGK
jgi:hypothetical protein